MTRRLLAASVLTVLASCQNYNFNPVGQCAIQPGSARVSLSGQSTADILFVVDDSGSMASEQQRLADNFGAFIGKLAEMESQRKASGLEPLEFHIAITTSSIFEAWEPQTANSPTAPPATTCGQTTPNVCTVNTPRNGWTDPVGQNELPYNYTCTTAGVGCVDTITKYYVQQCNLGLGVYKADYPAGNFVAAPSVVNPTNPRVLHFTKDLAWETYGTPSQDPKITTLVTQFAQNIKVGACGSGMEQHLEAGRLAVEKAIAGTQPGVVPSEWPHPGAKLVVVWVGDEDDCSNPKDPNKSLFFTFGADAPGGDVCRNEERKAIADQKLLKIQDYVDYFTTLGKPIGAAFIYSTDPGSCQADALGNIVCTPGTCACQCPPSCNGQCGPNAAGACNIPAECGGKSDGTRFHDLAVGLRGKGASTLEASVCDWNFGQTLQRIAELVKPVDRLTLPTPPATTQVALLRIENSSGQTVKQCAPPDPACCGPGPDKDWQFVDCQTGQPAPTGATTACIAINHVTGRCEANPGETYVAQYLGVVPPPSTTNPQGGCGTPSSTSDECAVAIDGSATTKDHWTCTATATARGTCLCNPGT